MSPAVYVQTKDSTENEVIAFSRGENGAPAPAGAGPRVGAGRVAALGLGGFRRTQ